MNKELQDKLDEFIKDFLDQKEIKQYLLIKEDISSSSELKDLNERLTKAKKNLALSFGKANYDECRKEYDSLKNQIDNHPLIVNFNVLQEEVSYLLDELESKLK